MNNNDWERPQQQDDPRPEGTEYHYKREELPREDAGADSARGWQTGTAGGSGWQASAGGGPQPRYGGPGTTGSYQTPYSSAGAGNGPVYSHMFSDGKPPRPARPRQRVNGLTVALCVVLSLAVGFGGGAAGALLFGRSSGIPGGGSTVLYEAADRTGAVDDGASSWTTVVRDTIDSVVEVVTERRATTTFFGQYVTQGAGSGVIITTDGYIVTNNHVVSSASAVRVTIGGEEYPAAVVGSDPSTDLAVIKINVEGLTPAVFANPESIQVGEAVIAIGNPLMLGGSVTSGIISSLGREVEVNGHRMTLLQTSAAVNPGNSGGGLFNAYGELVGIVNAKPAPRGSDSGNTVDGIGFAIPVGTVKEVASSLIEVGHVTGRVAMGIQVIQVSNAETASQYGVDRYGVYVVSVDEGYGAEAAGLRAGDYLLSVDGVLVEKTADVTSLLLNHKEGDRIVVQVIRGGELLSFEVELREREA